MLLPYQTYSLMWRFSALPIPYIMGLHITKSQKRAIILMFAIGGCVCAASILRLVSVVSQPGDEDLPWNFAHTTIWATVEANIAIISACSPALRPIWNLIRGKKARDAESSDLHEQHAAAAAAVKNVQKGRSPHSWALLMLKSKVAADEGGQTLNSHTYVNSGNSTEGLYRGPTTDENGHGSSFMPC